MSSLPPLFGTLGARLALAGLAVLTVLILVGALWRRSFGPMLLFDLVRTARRGRYLLLRFSYAALLIGLLFLSYQSWADMHRHGAESGYLFRNARDLSEFADRFFLTFVAVQFLGAVLLTPLFTAGAIAEEKERRTLDYLLSTDLNNREIVLSKLAARLAYMLLFLLTGLPILSLLQFLGGVDPNQVLASYAVTGATMLSLGSLAILASVYNRTTWDAVFRTFLLAMTYVVFTSYGGMVADKGLYASAWCNAGNPMLALMQLEEAVTRNVPSADALGGIVLSYCCYHLGAAIVFAAWAVWRLRAVALIQAGTDADASPAVNDPPSVRRRPHMGHDPLVWKEIYEKPVRWYGNPTRFQIGLLTVGVVLSYLVMLVQLPFLDRAKELNVLVTFGGMAWYGFMLLLVALSAAGRFSREIERQTLDSLLLVPTREHVLYAKWLGSVLHVRGGWWFLGWMMSLGWFRGMSLQCLVLLVVCWWVYAAFLASVGLWYSLLTRSTLRATIWTPVTAFLIGLGALGIVRYGYETGLYPFWFRVLQRDGLEDLGMAAPITLWLRVFSYEHYLSDTWFQLLLTALPGLLFYTLAGWFFWMLARVRFRSLTGGPPVRRLRPAATTFVPDNFDELFAAPVERMTKDEIRMMRE